GAARQTSVYIGSEEVLVRQAAGTNCLFNLGSSWFPGNSASYSLTVPAPPGCAWSVTSAPEWLVLTSTTSGTGPGQIPYTLTTNGNSVRSGLLTLSTGQSFGLSQMPGACTGSGTSTSWFPFAGGTYTFHFTAPAGCGWTLAPTDNWVHVNSSLSGSGSSSVTFTLDPNIGPGRSAMIFVIFPGGSVTLTIQQPPYVFNGPCTYSVTYSNQPLQPYAGTPAIILNTQNGCPWTAVSNSTWAVVPLSAGYGPTVLPVAVAANTSPAARTATLVIGGQTVTLTQSGVICNLTFGSSGSFFPPSAGLYDGLPVFGQEGCPWNVSSTASFVQIASGPMSGSGTLAIFIESNPGAVRTATLTLAGGATFTVTQTGSPCGVFFAPSQSWFPASGGTYLLNIATGPNCPWSVSSLNPWIVAASSGAGPGQVSVTIQPNTTGGYRAGYVYAGTSSFRVDQVGQ
ncbi:MAG: BACON domain-containing protein, partial [Bryobacterales bacterium]|nr:BACON domain-containing protein [Bryobacterales bacterium]